MSWIEPDGQVAKARSTLPGRQESDACLGVKVAT